MIQNEKNKENIVQFACTYYNILCCSDLITISDVNIYDAGWKEVPGESQWQG